MDGGSPSTSRSKEWRAVIGHKESTAEAMLSARSWIEFDDAKAKELTGGYAHAEGKAKPYLLRGLSSSQAGGVSIWTNRNREVGVAGGVLSHSPVRLHKQCYIAWLDFQPRKVWVS